MEELNRRYCKMNQSYIHTYIHTYLALHCITLHYITLHTYIYSDFLEWIAIFQDAK